MRALLLAGLLAGVARGGPGGDDAAAVARLLDAVPAETDAPAGGAGFRLTPAGRLELHARDLAVADALAQLRILLRRNIVVAPEVKSRFTGDLYDVTLDEALRVICRSTGLVARAQGTLIYVGPAAAESRLLRLRYVRAGDLVPFLKPLLGPDGKIAATERAETGLQPDQESVGGDTYAAAETILVSDLPENLARIEEAVAVLDVRPRQVLIEATILTASLDDDHALGVEFTTLAGVDFRTLGAQSPGGTSVTLGNVPDPQLDDSTGVAETNLLNGLPTDGLNVGFLKNSIGVFLRALDEVTDVTVLANPKILALNKQRGEVIVGRRDGYLTTTVTETSTVQTVEFLETGTRLLFRPFITGDGYVRLEVHPEDSSGGVTSEGLPFKDTAEVTTNILVKDGHTVVIGGLFRERAVTNRKKVPGLGDVPVAGAAFKSRQLQLRREEIIVLLTLRVLDTPDAEEEERNRARASERVARVYLSQAIGQLRRGKHDRARALIAAAEALQPGLPEIKTLRHRVSSRALSAEAARALDALVRERAGEKK